MEATTHTHEPQHTTLQTRPLHNTIMTRRYFFDAPSPRPVTASTHAFTLAVERLRPARSACSSEDTALFAALQGTRHFQVRANELVAPCFANQGDPNKISGGNRDSGCRTDEGTRCVGATVRQRQPTARSHTHPTARARRSTFFLTHCETNSQNSGEKASVRRNKKSGRQRTLAIARKEKNTAQDALSHHSVLLSSLGASDSMIV